MRASWQEPSIEIIEVCNNLAVSVLMMTGEGARKCHLGGDVVLTRSHSDIFASTKTLTCDVHCLLRGIFDLECVRVRGSCVFKTERKTTVCYAETFARCGQRSVWSSNVYQNSCRSLETDATVDSHRDRIPIQIVTWTPAARVQEGALQKQSKVHLWSGKESSFQVRFSSIVRRALGMCMTFCVTNKEEKMTLVSPTWSATFWLSPCPMAHCVM